MDIFLQIVGLVVLIGSMIVGYRTWIAPRSLPTQPRLLLLLVMLTFWGGFLGSFGWWFDVTESFSWNLPPLASRMLASAGLSFAALTFLTLRHPSNRRIRLVLWMLFVYLSPLAIAIVLQHLYRFDPSAPITYAFFIIVTPMALSALWYLTRPVSIQADEPIDIQPANNSVKLWLQIVAVVTFLWGLALFTNDNGQSDFIWVWRGDLLTSQLIGVMLLTIAVGAIFSFHYHDTARMMLWVLAVYGLGLTVAGLWNTLASKPIPLSYVIVFGLIFLISGVFLWRDTSTQSNR